MEETPQIVHLSLLEDDNLRALFNDGLLRQLKSVMAKNNALEERNRRMEKMYADQGVKLEQVKEENEKLYSQLQSQMNEQNYGIVHESEFVVTASRLHFKNAEGEHPTHEWTVSFWLNLNEVACMPIENGEMLINCAFYVGFVYKIITEDNKLVYNYCGTRDDFTEEWNDNVANRQIGMRKSKLTCKSNSLTAALNKHIYKDVAMADWRILSISGGEDCDKYNVGCKLRKLIESFKL